MTTKSRRQMHGKTFGPTPWRRCPQRHNEDIAFRKAQRRLTNAVNLAARDFRRLATAYAVLGKATR